MKIVLAGGTGFIGTLLVRRLIEEQHDLVLLTRFPQSAPVAPAASLKLVQWDGRTQDAWISHLDGADAVINLCGESLAGGRWTRKRKNLLVQSRVEPTKALVTAMAQARRQPSVLINASGVGYYGNVDAGDVDESHDRGNDFLADLCVRWESEAVEAVKLGVRVVLLRNGVVLGRDGGALKKLALPFRYFIGGHLGSGQQWFPWIHRADVVSIITLGLGHSTLSGPLNVVAPEAVSLRDFCNILGRIMNRPSWAPVPAFVLHTALGEMAEMLLTGQRAIPRKLQDAGFEYRYPRLEQALRGIMETRTCIPATRKS